MWVRTYHDGDRWMWRHATSEEIRLAKSQEIPVHMLYPHGAI